MLFRALADAYAEYVEREPETLLCRLVGAHCLELHGQRFFFIVQENACHGSKEPPELYDVKGSWVGRAASPPMAGSVVTCRYCNERYKYVPATSRRRRSTTFGRSAPRGAEATTRAPRGGAEGSLRPSAPHQRGTEHSLRVSTTTPRGSASTTSPSRSRTSTMARRRSLSSQGSSSSDPCPLTDHGHEPLLVRKDNDVDLDLPLRFADTDAAARLLGQLERDTAFLRDHGIMDYSLLLGVQRAAPSRLTNCSRTSNDSSRASSAWDVGAGAASSSEHSGGVSRSASARESSTVSFGAAGSPTTRSVSFESNAAPPSESGLQTTTPSSAAAEDPSTTQNGGPFARLWRGLTTDGSPEKESAVPEDAPFRRGGRPNVVEAADPRPEDGPCPPLQYYVAVIDVLQAWDFSKKGEVLVKSTILRKDPAGISAVEPAHYQSRFMARCRELLEPRDVSRMSGFEIDGGAHGAALV